MRIFIDKCTAAGCEASSVDGRGRYGALRRLPFDIQLVRMRTSTRLETRLSKGRVRISVSE